MLEIQKILPLIRYIILKSNWNRIKIELTSIMPKMVKDPWFKFNTQNTKDTSVN